MLAALYVIPGKHPLYDKLDVIAWIDIEEDYYLALQRAEGRNDNACLQLANWGVTLYMLISAEDWLRGLINGLHGAIDDYRKNLSLVTADTVLSRAVAIDATFHP